MVGFLNGFMDWGWLWFLLGLLSLPVLRRLPELLFGLIEVLMEVFD